MKEVVVLGAGLCGLSTAWKLAESGTSVTVLEAQPTVGGLAKSLRYKGFSFDMGPHRLFSYENAIMVAIDELLGRAMITHTRRSRIRVDERWVDYPVTPRSLLQLGPTRMWGSLRDYAVERVRSRIATPLDSSLEDWLLARFGATLYQALFEEFCHKLWGIHPSEMSADWAVQRILMLDLSAAFKRAILGEPRRSRTMVKDFCCPEEGIGCLAEAMADRVTELGGEIVTSAPATEVDLRHPGRAVIRHTRGGVEAEIEAAHVVSTIPLPYLIRLLRPLAPHGVLVAATSLRFRSLILVNLALDTGERPSDHWLYFPDRRFVFNRVTFPTAFGACRAPAGKSSLVAELTCDPADELWNAGTGELVDRCLDSLTRLGLARADQVADAVVHRETHAYPVFDLQYRGHLDQALGYVNALRNITSVGRQGLFRYSNMDHSISMGFRLARELVSGRASAARKVGTETLYFG